MQYYNNQYNPAPYTMPPVYQQPQPDPKAAEKRMLRKTSNGLGFFLVVYFLVMQTVLTIVVFAIQQLNGVTEQFVYSLEVFIYAVSPLTACFFYRILSKNRISDYFPKSYVPLKKLVPMILIGMSVAMIANEFAIMFDDNISMFNIKNYADSSDTTQTWIQLIFSFITTAILPAFAEEIAFRGIFMGVMRKHGDAFAILSSSLVFGLMHGNTTQIVFAFTLGLIFGYLDCKANSIVPSVILHFANNFYAVLREGMSTALKDYTANVLFASALIMLFCLLGILSFIYLSRADKQFFKLSNSDKNNFSKVDNLTLKEKFSSFFACPGIIVFSAMLITETIYNLIPQETLSQLMGAL